MEISGRVIPSLNGLTIIEFPPVYGSLGCNQSSDRACVNGSDRESFMPIKNAAIGI